MKFRIFFNRPAIPEDRGAMTLKPIVLEKVLNRIGLFNLVVYWETSRTSHNI